MLCIGSCIECISFMFVICYLCNCVPFNIFTLYCLDQIMEFAIVTFMEDNSVAVVPTCWVVYDSHHRAVSCWPPASKARKVEKMVKDRVDPAPDWSSYSVRVLHEYGMFVIL